MANPGCSVCSRIMQIKSKNAATKSGFTNVPASLVLSGLRFYSLPLSLCTALWPRLSPCSLYRLSATRLDRLSPSSRATRPQSHYFFSFALLRGGDPPGRICSTVAYSGSRWLIFLRRSSRMRFFFVTYSISEAAGREYPRKSEFGLRCGNFLGDSIRIAGPTSRRAPR